MKDKILELAKLFIAIDSSQDNSGGRDKVLTIARTYLKDFNSLEFESNGYKSIFFHNQGKMPKHFKVILNAHLDVVPGKKEQFVPAIKNNKLYGRGSYDMKSAAAVEILLFRELAPKLNYPIGLQIVTDEEVGGFDGTKYQIDQMKLKADFVIVGEYTDLKVTNQAKGIIWLKLTTKGKDAHGAYPWLGQNAILKMNKILDRLLTEYPVPKDSAWQTCINVAKISSPNETFNKVPDECIANLDVRFTPSEKDTILPKLKKIIGGDAKVEVIFNEVSHYTKPDNKHVKLLQKCTNKTLKKEIPLRKTYGGSDIRFYSRIGVDGVEFGPTGANMHQEGEWVDIESVVDYYHILKNFLAELNLK